MPAKEERALQLFRSGYNCAQAVFGVFAEEGGLEMDTALKLANGFGGGVRCGDVCGAVAGAILAIGLRCGFHTDGDFAQKGYCNAKTYEFVTSFKETNGSIVCRDLLGADIRCPEDHTRPEAREAHKTVCPQLVMTAARILEGMEFREPGGSV
jgi:C_GCAxxG_C_C family probable redox protein